MWQWCVSTHLNNIGDAIADIERHRTRQNALAQ
jgi:hypothetical protein